jgi:hypothetical protein
LAERLPGDACEPFALNFSREIKHKESCKSFSLPSFPLHKGSREFTTRFLRYFPVSAQRDGKSRRALLSGGIRDKEGKKEIRKKLLLCLIGWISFKVRFVLGLVVITPSTSRL